VPLQQSSSSSSFYSSHTVLPLPVILDCSSDCLQIRKRRRNQEQEQEQEQEQQEQIQSKIHCYANSNQPIYNFDFDNKNRWLDEFSNQEIQEFLSKINREEQYQQIGILLR